MGNLVTKEVNFNGSNLMAVQTEDGKIHVGVKWICQGLGLNDNQRIAQMKKIREDVVLERGVIKILLPTSSGKQETLCIELDFLPLWLAKINANIINDSVVQEKLIDYQLNAAKVLAKAFTETPSVPQVTTSTKPRYRARMINTAIKDVDATVKTLQKMFGVREGIAQETAIEMVEDVYGIDMTPVRKLIPSATHDTGYMNATMVGERSGGMSARDVNLKLEALGLQRREITDKGEKRWRLTEAGKEYAEEKPYKKNGHSGYHINWNEKVLKLLGKEVA